MRRSIRRYAWCGLIALCVYGAADAASRPEAGDMAPDYAGTTLDDRATSVSDFRGRVVVLSFWASWCGPCLKEMPILEGIQERAGKNQIQVVAVIPNRSRPIAVWPRSSPASNCWSRTTMGARDRRRMASTGSRTW